MDYRQKSRAMLIRDEGLRLRAYKCPAGFWTIGVGRNLSSRGVGGAKLLYYRTIGISHEVAMSWLDEDVAAAETDCRALFGAELFDSWSEDRRLGWVNMAFNLGRDRLAKFVNTIRHAKAGRWDCVRIQLRNSLWYRQVKGRAGSVIGLICDERWTYD